MKRWFTILLVAASVVPATLAGALLDCASNSCPTACCSKMKTQCDGAPMLDVRHESCGCACGMSQGNAPLSAENDLGILLTAHNTVDVAVVDSGLPEGSIPPFSAFHGLTDRTTHSTASAPVYLLLCSFIS